MFIREKRQSWILIIIPILFVIGHCNCIHLIRICDWCFCFVGKAFLITIFFLINVHPWNETNLDTRSNLCSFCYVHHNHVLLIRIHDIEVLDLLGKAFLCTISYRINVHPRNETNLDTHDNLHSFCYVHYNQVPLIGIHDIDAWDLQEKLFFPPFSL